MGRIGVLGALLLLAGCGGGLVAANGATATEDSALGDAQVLDFRLDGVHAPALVMGNTAQVQYDANRLPGCRGDQYGHPAWSITGYYQLNGGAVGSFEAGGFSPSNGTQKAEIPLTESGDLAVWFEITNVWGCSAWDSDYGHNFHFQVAASAPTVSFNADWTVSTDGALRAGSPVTVKYDLSRLPRCRQDYNGYATWEITVSYRFDGGPVTTVPVTQVSGMDRVAAPATFQAPAGARDLELWFHNSDRAGCSDWDSDYGRNFHFTLQ